MCMRVQLTQTAADLHTASSALRDHKTQLAQTQATLVSVSLVSIGPCNDVHCKCFTN